MKIAATGFMLCTQTHFTATARPHTTSWSTVESPLLRRLQHGHECFTKGVH